MPQRTKNTGFVPPPLIATEDELVAVASALGAESVPLMCAATRALSANARVSRTVVSRFRREILDGKDPLGEAFCRLRLPEMRRTQGAIYTPLPLVRAMLSWARETDRPERIVDPGSGSGRFIAWAGRHFPSARLLAVENDPLAALLTRAHLATCGFAERSRVLVADYCRVDGLGDFDGKTLFVGNPPYVRHHQISPEAKHWLGETARGRGLKASRLAGLHAYFFLATSEHAKPGDFGAFVTSSEWLDVNYGGLIRALFLEHLGGEALHSLDPDGSPFPDTMTTAAIACFRVGRRSGAVRVQQVAVADQLAALEGGRKVKREQLAAARRWSPIVRGQTKPPGGYVELGELCKVRRGQVTGANKFWIWGDHAPRLPATVLFHTVTRARELFDAGLCLRDASHLRKVIDLPVDLDGFTGAERRAVERLLNLAKREGVHDGYVARNRRAWWAVGLHEPAPILATYMARRPPGFVRNLGRARHINIAHGIYPRVSLSERAITNLIKHLAETTSTSEGRTYAGGLTKFEPREMERLFVPEPTLLDAA